MKRDLKVLASILLLIIFTFTLVLLTSCSSIPDKSKHLDTYTDEVMLEMDDEFDTFDPSEFGEFDEEPVVKKPVVKKQAIKKKKRIKSKQKSKATKPKTTSNKKKTK